MAASHRLKNRAFVRASGLSALAFTCMLVGVLSGEASAGEDTEDLLEVLTNPSPLGQQSRQLLLARECLQRGYAFSTGELETLTQELAQFAKSLDEAGRQRAKAEVDLGPAPIANRFLCSSLHRAFLDRAKRPSDSLPF